MTNREWVNTLSDEEFAKIFEVDEPYCTNCTVSGEDHQPCDKCLVEWLKRKHENPKPELKVGMFVDFVDVIDFSRKITKTGVIIPVQNENTDELVVMDNTGGWHWLSNIENNITRVYGKSVYSFNDTKDYKNFLWEKE